MRSWRPAWRALSGAAAGQGVMALPPGWSESSYFRYQREHLTLRLTMRKLTNHELREILVGLWARLDRDDQADHIKELQHYFDNRPGTFLSGLAQQIRDT